MKVPGILLISLALVAAGQLPDILLAENTERTIPVYGQLVPESAQETEENESEPEEDSDEEKEPDDGKPKEEEAMETFTKVPLDKQLYPGEETEYLLQGFGNNTGKIMQRYSLTDMFPEGLHFVKAEFPAFTKGKGLMYTITYITNQSDRRILHEKVSAEQPFLCESPELSEGEWIMYLTIKIPEVPDGFGVGDEIRITCRVDEEPPEMELVNRAKLGFNGVNERTDAQASVFADSGSRTDIEQAGNGADMEQPITGDDVRIWIWGGFAGLSAGVMLLTYIRLRRKSGEERQRWR